MAERDFIPFGAQYYRAPTPKRTEWATDLRNMRQMGFNTVKYWAQWRWSNPAEGEYYFDDLDELMDLAANEGLNVVINVIFDVAPAWFYRKYPDSLMVTEGGRSLKPQVAASRQIGGAPGPCYHHEPGQRERQNFLRELVQRYREHAAMDLWDLWNEPELTCEAWREPKLENLVCYCPRCVEAFRRWLKEKYEDLERLNQLWGRNYRTWSELEAPRNTGVFKPMIDWRLFFADTITAELKRRVAVVKEIDQVHSVMIHTVPPPHFNMISCCSDDYQLAKLCDLFGNSLGSSPFAATLSRSSAPGKKVINAEIHLNSGTPFNQFPRPGRAELKRHLLVPLSRGIKGFLFWQYRPETIGLESPMWGMANIDGSKTQLLTEAEQINRTLQDNAQLINAAEPAPAKIAVVNGKENQIFDWCDKQTVDRHFKAVNGAFEGLYRRGHNVDIISTDQVREGVIGRYSMIYYPYAYYMDQDVAGILKKWVAQGGMLVAELCFAGIRGSDGLHSRIVPGYGFDEVFGVRDKEVLTASEFLSSYNQQWGAEDLERNQWPIRMVRGFDSLDKGADVLGYYWREALEVETAEVLGRFADGAAAVTLNEYHRGRAIMIGSLLSHNFSEMRTVNNAKFMDSLAAMAKVESIVQSDSPQVRGDLLTTEDGRAILVAVNLGDEPAEAKLSIRAKDIPIQSPEFLKNIIEIAEVKLKDKDGLLSCNVQLQAGGAELYAIR